MNNDNVRENVVAGIVGAFLFSLAGGIVWFVLYLLGFLAGISGLIGVVCAVKGYSIFSKKESMKGIIISAVVAILVMVLAWYLCIGYDICQAYKDWYAEGYIDYTLTYFESVQVIPVFLEDPEVGPLCFKDLAMGLIFCVIGGGSYVVNKIKSIKAEQENSIFKKYESYTEPTVENGENKE